MTVVVRDSNSRAEGDVRFRAVRRLFVSGSPRLWLAALAACAVGCAAEEQGGGALVQDLPAGPTAGSPPTMDLPTGPPPEMDWPDAAVTRPPQPDAGPPSAPDAGPPSAPDAGSDTGVDASVPDEDGPLNMAPVTFGRNVKVNDDTGRAQQTEVLLAARPDGLLFAGWIDNRQSPSRCGFSVSRDGGVTWGRNFFASTQGSGRAFAGDPALAIDHAGNLYAGCQDYASGGLGTNYVLLAHSKDDGATWSPFRRVNQSLDKPWLGGANDGTVILSWLGRPGGVKRSTDYGATWEPTISLGSLNHGTTISVGNTGLVHMGFNTRETTVTYRRSRDYGATFGPARDLSSQGTPCRSPCSPRSHPIVGGDTDPTGQVVALTWASTQNHPDAEGDDDVWVIVSYDAGDTWSRPIRVNDNRTPSRQFQSWAAVDKYGAVHVVWTDLRDNGENSTYYARMTDIEQGFEPNVKVNDGGGRPAGFLGDYKGIAIQGRDVVVVWQDTRNDSGDIYFARARDAAAAGGPLLR
jgi:hypothetical protein